MGEKNTFNLRKSNPIGTGSYRFMQFMPDGSLVPCVCQCEIMSQTEKTLVIRLLSPNVNGHRYGDEIRVQKKSVTWHTTVDCTDKWWNNN